MKKIVLYIGLFLSASVVFSQTIMVEKKVEQHCTYRMLNNQDSLGFSKVDIEKIDGYYRLKELTKVPSFHEAISAYFKPDLTMDSVRVHGNFGDKQLDCFSEFKNQEITGYFGFPVIPGQDPNTIHLVPKADHFYERTISIFVLPLHLEPQMEELQFQQFNSTNGKVETIRVNLLEKHVKVKVPAGDFLCDKIEFSGGSAEQIFYISKQKIIKIEIKNQPWVYELLRD